MSSGYRPPGIRERTFTHVRADGAAVVAGTLLRWACQYAAGLLGAYTGASRTFEFSGSRYSYLVHRYNWTWLNERAIEVPIVRAAVAGATGRTLEVGNVLGHYGPRDHLVVDRYETGDGVINADVLSFSDPDGFDLIVSISTLEHVGWDEAPRDPAAAGQGLRHLAGLLRPGGVLLATVPVGYNAGLDGDLRAGRVEVTELRALRREARRNVWHEVDPADVWDATYDSLLYTAHGIVVCRFVREAADSAAARPAAGSG